MIPWFIQGAILVAGLSLPFVGYLIGHWIWRSSPRERSKQILVKYYGMSGCALPVLGFFLCLPDSTIVHFLRGLTAVFLLGLWGGSPFVGLGVLLRLRPERVVRMNLCERCTYDLTGNRSGVCPECGRVIPERQKVLLSKYYASRGPDDDSTR